MSEPDTSPFAEPKSRRWVWIVPSVLLHLIILVVWLLLPEPEPRQPGERKLTIKEEQAEELQEHLEEANLKQLREKVSALQSIKEEMLRIREREMAQVGNFEAAMVQEAPRDIAGLLRELAGIYASLHEDYDSIGASLEIYREWQPKIRQAAEKDTIEGLRLLPNLKPYWEVHTRDSGNGLYDRFEVAFFETGSVFNAIEVKLEWIDDAKLVESVEALKAPLETAEKQHWELWRAVPSSWKQAGAFKNLTEDLEKTIDTVVRFRQSEIEGKAAAEASIKELEAKIAETEAELETSQAAQQAAAEALESIDRSKDRDAWNAARNEVNRERGRQGQLARDLKNLQRDLSRAPYKPDPQLARAVKSIEGGLTFCAPEPPAPGFMADGRSSHEALMDHLEGLAQSLEVTQ